MTHSYVGRDNSATEHWLHCLVSSLETSYIFSEFKSIDKVVESIAKKTGR